MRVLLVEDELAIATAVARSMKRWGHEPFVAHSLAEARKLAADKAPEALVSDLKLPDGRGIDFAISLGVPFIIMSGYANFDDAVDALRVGCVDFLTKPVAMKDLQSSMTRLSDRVSSWDMAVVDPALANLQVLRPAADGIRSQPFSAQEVAWTNRQQSRVRFDDIKDDGSSVERQQLVAELMQASEQGRLVINRGEHWWRAWLEASVDWEPDGEQRDRRQVIEQLTDRAIFRPNGVVVECTQHA